MRSPKGLADSLLATKERWRTTKKALESQGHFFEKLSDFDKSPKVIFKMTVGQLRYCPTKKADLERSAFILPRSKLLQFHNLLTELNSHTFALDKLRQNTIESIQYENVEQN